MTRASVVEEDDSFGEKDFFRLKPIPHLSLLSSSDLDVQGQTEAASTSLTTTTTRRMRRQRRLPLKSETDNWTK